MPVRHKAAAEAGYIWRKVTDEAAFPGRDGAGALVYDGKMWLIGGWNPGDKKTNPIHSNCNNEVWNSADGAAWSLVKPNSHFDDRFDPASDWEARHTAGYAVYRDKMWIIGGDPLLGHYQFDVWNSADGRTWCRVNREDAPWGPRVLHYTVAFKDELWVMGGQTLPQFAPADEIFYNDVWSSADGARWTRVLEHAPWSPRGMIGGAAVFKERIWLIGGGTYETASRPYGGYGEVWSSADGRTWDLHTKDVPWSPRVYHDVAVFDDKLWMMEGQHVPGSKNDGCASADVWFSADGEHWQKLPATPWARRHAASVFVFQNALWMVAGNYMGRDVWKLTRK